jgi:hypothetical protein
MDSSLPDLLNERLFPPLPTTDSMAFLERASPDESPDERELSRDGIPPTKVPGSFDFIPASDGTAVRVTALAERVTALAPRTTLLSSSPPGRSSCALGASARAALAARARTQEEAPPQEEGEEGSRERDHHSCTGLTRVPLEGGREAAGQKSKW